MLSHGFANLEILELIGLGGSAEVYRALDLRQNREVAVKVLAERAEPEMVLRFVREGRVLSRLRHAHIIQVFEMGDAQGQRYLVMELVSGGSLKERLQKGKIPWREAVQIAVQVAQALEHAHASDVIHRDVKPGNIMFDAAGQAKLTDFGLAHLSDASTMTRTGTVMGTVFYLSPEQAVGRAVDGRSDLYALGAVLFEMVTGQPPFTGPSAVSIIYKHLNEQPAKLRQSDASLPVALEAVVDRLLQKDPARRYPSATETIAALQEVLVAPEGMAASAAPGLAHDGAGAALGEVALSGRKSELLALTTALERASAGLGGLVFVVGEAGLGKTRLARALAERARESNVLTLVGECLYSDAPSPYAPMVQMIAAYEEQSHGRAMASDTPASAGVPLAGRAAETAAALAEVRAVLQLDGADRATWLRTATVQDAQAHAFERLSQFFQALSRERPLLLVLDDLQWASPTTLQFWHYLARSVRGARLLLVGCFRPEDILSGASGEMHPLQEMLRRMSRERLYEEIKLAPLSAEEVVELASAATGIAPLDQELGTVLFRESEGNPFYLLEIVRLLQEQKALGQVQEHWELVAPIGEIDIPATVRDVVMRRVERATREDRELLDWAAVVGQRLEVGVLAPLVGGSRLEVMRRLHGLEQRYGLLLADELGFAFAHHKVREVIYEEMPFALRREYHLMVGEVLEQLAPEEPDAYTYDLARHYVQAGHKAKGAKYALAAADKAEAAFAPSEAVTYVEQALALGVAQNASTDSTRKRLSLLQRYARLLLTVGRQDEACRTFSEALTLGRGVSDQRAEVEILLDLAQARGRMGDWAAALELGEESLRLAHGLAAEDPGYAAEHQASALTSTAFFAFERGGWEESIIRLEKALALAQEPGLELLQARILGNMGIINDARGDRLAAIGLYQRSIDTFARQHQPLDVGRGLSNMGFSYYRLGDQAAAADCFRSALEALGKVGDVREQGLVHLHMAEAAVARGALAEAREHCAQARRHFTRLGFELGTADVDRIHAAIARKEERWAVAERYLREALEVYEAHGDQLNLAETHAELGQLLADMGQHRGAEDELHRSRLMYDSLRGIDPGSAPQA
jgi:eukaryotic-like serine/threonine-protein kinase